ncbi:protoporphyrinogen/coproporphyrinogen oxidase [Cryobacterium psychrophilum]|uniref:FAD-dependent oxidoreductase n=1 Tax=Cryobacterium psychrophilum TaxID=41988 RepID=A0A4Y8KP65_9MICO|nr:FAD-dependent oxidoreductase [Cryobacterium psychrophilum]TDW30277.1 oxygen-dependent protoporphyrinogen oxidase [Cryobacterium psychrophilum]TFD77495.1 FAD-dependent oxidoreductase [Cryobacterium psychrophilum]
MQDVVVIGGGIAGLVAARACARLGLGVTIIEAADAVGGPVAGHEIAGLRLDSGAESFAVRGGTVAAFVEELGLTEEIVAPNPAGAWLHLPALKADQGSVSVPLPQAGVLGIPGSPLAEDVRRVIGWGGALRAYLDRLMPVLTIGREHSLGDLVGKRMGRRVLERLVEPVASGVYTTSSRDLEIDVVAPGLNRALTTTGSLSGAVLALRSGAPAGSMVGGLRGGMSRLPAALLADLEHFGAVIETGRAATSLVRIDATADSEQGWAITLAPTDADSVETATDSAPDPADAERTARFVIVATQGRQALRLLAPLGVAHDALSELEWPGPTAVTLATLVLDAPELDAHPRGTGVLVAAEATDVAAKALTHVTAKWSWVAAAAGPGRHVVRLSYGRVGQANPAEGVTDEDLEALALRDASVLLGTSLSAGMVRGFARTEWRDAISPATIGAPERVTSVREALSDTPGLEVTGAWLAGTGLASVIPDALAAAGRIRQASLGL